MTSLTYILKPITDRGLERHLPLVITLIMVALLAHSLALLSWKLLPSAPAPMLPAATLTQGGERQADAAAPLPPISQWHLFGEASQTPLTPAKTDIVPDTRLDLKLRGVVASSNPLLASAIVADTRGVEDVYGINDTLPGEAILKEIHKDLVIIEYRGRLETLRLPTDEVPDGRNGSSTRAIAPQSSSEIIGGDTATVDVMDTEIPALLAHYRNELINNPQNVMDLIRATPVQNPDTGQYLGFRVSPGKDRRLLGRFGLRAGDVVTAINGVALDNPIKALEVVQGLATANAVNLQIERRGEKLNMDYQVGE